MNGGEASTGRFSFKAETPQAAVITIIAAGALLRFVLAATIGLGVDESYAVAIARHFSLSYFDHPPLHFWIAGAFAKLAGSERGEVVRLPFVLCFAGTTWLTFRLAARLFNERAGVIAALLLNVSAVFSLSTGGWVLPDGPLMLFAMASANVLAELLFVSSTKTTNDQPTTKHSPLLLWSTAGLFAGLAMLSKYHGLFLLAGTFAFLLTSPPHRRWLAHPGPYLAAFIAVACFTPVLVWNARHEWASFAFQGARVAPGGLHVDTLFQNIGGQMAWVLPWIFVPLAATFWRAARGGPRDAARWFLLSLGAGPIVVFTLVALRGDVGLPHWEAPGWLFLFPALGAAVAERFAAAERAGTDPNDGSLRRATRARRWVRASAWAYVGLIALLGSHASTGWIARVFPGALARGDPTGDLVDWRQLKPALAARGYYPVRGFVAATSWIQAGKAAVALGPGVPVVCLCNDPHHFQFIAPDSAFVGAEGIIVHKERAGDDVGQRFSSSFEQLVPLERFGVFRGRQQVMTLEVFRGDGYRGSPRNRQNVSSPR